MQKGQSDNHPEVETSLDLILQRLEAISTESRQARDEMAKEARTDDILKSLATLRSRSETSSTANLPNESGVRHETGSDTPGPSRA